MDLTGLSYVLPDSISDVKISVIDTSDLIGALLGDGAGDKRSLEKTCSLLQIQTEYLHNAGNDAHVCVPFWLASVFEHLLGLSSIPCSP